MKVSSLAAPDFRDFHFSSLSAAECFFFGLLSQIYFLHILRYCVVHCCFFVKIQILKKKTIIPVSEDLQKKCR